MWEIKCADVLAALMEMESGTADAVLCDPPYGISFMGKQWDRGVPSVDVWRELLRVCKPGAPLLAFGGTRTYHRQTSAIENAGWEIRDCLSWLYGSGFPKSFAVAKQPGCEEGWSGYGTALKPAWEPCVLARKPLDGTVAANVLAHGVGALNVDGTRIGRNVGERTEYGRDNPLPPIASVALGAFKELSPYPPHDAGRWPANVCLDEEAAAALDEHTGERPGGRPVSGKVKADGFLKGKETIPFAGYLDNGGASRFFYTAKVSRKERERGCEALPLLTAAEATDRGEGEAALNSPRTGASRTGGARNHHPTLKPIALTTWLAKLLLPPVPGTLLVPFSGAGSEMIGALLAGWTRVVGIELEPEYVAIAKARIAAHTKHAA